MLATLSQRRYRGLFGLSVVIAALCVLAGSWQVARFGQKRSANDIYRANSRAPITAVDQLLGRPEDARELQASPTTAAQRDRNKFSRVSATGVYLSGQQSLLRGQTINGDVGYVVVTPLRTGTGVLLVARGFIAQHNAADTSPKNVPAPPNGMVTVDVRLEPTSIKADRYSQLPGIQIDTVNAADQANRLAQPVWNTYGELLPGQPGSAQLVAIPAPDMSNPAGGAEEPQHAAYVVQWYLFALLALAAPFLLATAERRRQLEAGDLGEHKPTLDERLAGRS